MPMLVPTKYPAILIAFVALIAFSAVAILSRSDDRAQITVDVEGRSFILEFGAPVANLGNVARVVMDRDAFVESLVYNPQTGIPAVNAKLNDERVLVRTDGKLREVRRVDRRKP